MKKRSSNPSFFLIFLSIQLLSLAIISNAATDTITTMQIIRDGDTIVSSAQKFELGFFSPGSSRNRYVGIWYKNIAVMTVVWVANRETPLRNTTSGVLTLNSRGQLIIRDEGNNKNTTIWSTNYTSSVAQRNPAVQLLDSGNLVIRDTNSASDDNYVWRSFDYPSNTYIPGMGYGVNLVTGQQIHLTSWKSDEDPSIGDFTVGLEVTGYPQFVIKRGDVLLHRQGPWDGARFSGLAKHTPSSVIETVIVNSTLMYYSVSTPTMTILRLSPSGIGQLVAWVDQAHDWHLLNKFPADICDDYGYCGPHGSCNTGNLPVCGCLQRFVPRDRESWATTDWSGGCVRRTPLNCSNDVFLKYTGIKMPDARHAWHNDSLSLEECEAVCSRNCSCTAFFNLNISGNGGNGCLLWFGDLIDIKQVSGETEEIIYIRMSASELDSNVKKNTILIVVLASLAGIVLLGLSLALFIWKRKNNDEKLKKEGEDIFHICEVKEGHGESIGKDIQLHIYDLSTISKATDSFSNKNKLGEGGFGSVYKGMLDDGKEIAVKRLSQISSQGVGEFKNEIICIAKLQHRNLVKLLGCCIQEEEKILIYEYMPNKSLDFFLFDKTKSKHLDWPKRFHVINGIVKGLVYLHQDSRQRIIHRDLKASNILLDDDLNPKITDFGVAKIFEGNETKANTKRVVGTYGYMSPEYAGYGLCSLKSDVYSFGVLVLEIVSGQKSVDFYHSDHHHNLPRHAWILYKRGRFLELVDPDIANTTQLYELERTIHVALLCVQQCPEDRPTMSSVVLMLGSEGVLSEAKQPGFFTTSRKNVIHSSIEYTITQLEGR